MEQSFSQRMGLKPVKNIIQEGSMDDDLRSSLWNVVYTKIWVRSMASPQIDFQPFIDDIWIYFFKYTVDQAPKINNNALGTIKTYFFSCKWNEVYDFIQFIANNFPWDPVVQDFMQSCNYILSRELSAYQFVGKRIEPITSKREIAEIEQALNVSIRFTHHLDKALELLANKKAPDYTNSIKESISAVEAMCKLITGSSKVTLGDALRQIESKLGVLHPALKSAFNSLYGYTSDAEGIRHGTLGKSGLDVADAKFMLIACSAFINYLVAKAEKAGIKLDAIPNVGSSALSVLSQAAFKTFWRKSGKPARPYMERLIYFSLLIFPSTGPLL